MVVDAVVRNWISLVSGDVGGTYGWGKEILHLTAFLYAEDGLVASTDPEWLQGALNTLTRFFEKVGLQTKVVKTVWMLFRLCHAVET